MKKILFSIAACALLISCGNAKKSDQCTLTDSLKQEVKNESLMVEGSWIQPIPGQDGVQGFELVAGGKASSINMNTLTYKSWTLNDADSTLSLVAESAGNGQTFTDTMTYKIVKLKNDTLVLSKGGVEDIYTAKK